MMIYFILMLGFQRNKSSRSSSEFSSIITSELEDEEVGILDPADADLFPLGAETEICIHTMIVKGDDCAFCN